MGWFDKVSRRFVQGRETIGDDFLIETMPDTTTVGPVSLAEARGLPGVGRGARLIADVASQLPLYAQRNTDTPEITERVYPTPPLLRDPDPAGSPGPAWVWAVTDSLVWWGNAMALQDRPGADGYPRSLPLVDVTRVRWNNDDGVWEVTDDPNRPPEVHSPSEVLHMTVHRQAGQRLGIGLLDTYQTELKVMRAAEQAQYVLLDHGVPTGLLKVASGAAISTDDAQRIKDAWIKSQAQRSVAVMSNVDFTKVSFTADELSMIPTREFNLRLASDITGVPPYMLGVPSESRVYANAETEWTNFVRITLQPYLAPVEYALSTCLPSKGMWEQRARFDMTPLMRAEAKTRWDIYKIGAELGAITIDEIRNQEGLGPLPANTPDQTTPALEVVPDAANQ